MKTTLRDIAEDTGFSISTVSRSLKNTGQISEATRKAIFESAQKLDYPLNNSDTPLHFKKHLYVAVITSFQSGEFFTFLFNGFGEASALTKLEYCLCNIGHKEVDLVEFILDLRQDKFDAAVLFLPSLKAGDYSNIISQVPLDFPIVSAAPIVTPIIDTVTFDNYRGGHLVGKHFIERGYDTVGIITGSEIKNESKLRVNGFIDAISTSKQTDVIWQFRGDYLNASGKQAFKEFNGLTEKPRAVFACNDTMALSFMQQAQLHDYSIPTDVAVAGYDNQPFCQYSYPSLTSVSTDFVLLGKYVTDLLQSRMNKPTKHNGFINLIPVNLSIRSST